MGRMDQAIIRLTRKQGAGRDRWRRYLVLVDGEVVGKIRRGATSDFVVEPGNHSLRLKIDWVGSEQLRLAVSKGQTSGFVCGPNGKASAATLDLVRKAKPWIALAEE